MTTPIYVVTGQSNAGFLAGDLSLEQALSAENLDGDIVKSFQGGTQLAASTTASDWFPFNDGNSQTGELFNRLLNDVRSAVSSSSDGFLKSFLWIQGENDAGIIAASQQYEANLREFVTRIRDEFGEDFNFSIVQLGDGIPIRNNNNNGVSWDNVRQAQENIAKQFDFVTLLSPDDILQDAGLTFTHGGFDGFAPSAGGSPATNGLRDGIHYNNAGTLAIAEAYLEQFGDNERLGTDGNDTLRGSNNADYIFGDAGNDVIRSARGDDYVVGGNGNDRIIAGSGDDNVLGGAGADRIFGGRGDDTLGGGSGNDRIRAGGGNDELFGGTGADVLRGEGGNDILRGNEGNDRIFGGSGNDRIVGGSGNDTFFFGRGSGADTIFDFENNIDSINLSDWDFANTSEALSHATQSGNNVSFRFDDGSVLSLLNTSISDLSDDLII